MVGGSTGGLVVDRVEDAVDVVRAETHVVTVRQTV